MSTECKICEGTGNEPGELGCVWCDGTGKAGGLKPAPSDELAAFRAYMAASPMATYWSAWQERAKFSTAELQASHLREAALQELVTKADQLGDDLQTKLDESEQRNAELVAQSQQLKRLLGDAKANLNPTGRLAKAIDSAVNSNKALRRAQAPNVSVFSDAKEPPCTACFARGCNGECMENL